MQEQRFSQTVAGGAVVIAAFSVLSRVLGLIRDRLLAHGFGGSGTTDAYYAAFRLPDLVFQTLVLGALASAFIPLFVKLYRSRAEDGYRLASGVLTVLVVAMGGLAVAAIVAAPALVPLIAPGFSAEQLQLTTSLTRVMLLGVVLHAVSSVASGVLQGMRRFVAYSAAPVLYNLGLILGIVALVPAFGPIGLGWGVVVGALAHLTMDVVAARRAGWRPAWRWAWADPGVRQVARLMLPRTFGLAAGQLNQLAITIIASGLAAGSLTQLTWADNLQNVPTNVFGVPLAVATFPLLAQHVAADERDAFRSTLAQNLRRMAFLVLPLAALLVALRAHVVRVVLGSGAFDWEDTYYTAQVLGVLCVSLVCTSFTALVARAFYALGDTKTPVRWAVGSMAISVVLAVLLSRGWGAVPALGVVGIAAALSAASLIQVVGLGLTLRRRLGTYSDGELLRSLGKVALGSAVALAVARLVLELGQPLLAQRTFWGVLGQGMAAGGAGIAAYLGLSYLTNCEDIALLRRGHDRYVAPAWRWLRSWISK